jgi:pimeloyl-ACP methyl ester carboxylesterase
VSDPAASVTSKDGTSISWRRDGEGPPIVLVHGANGDRGNWISCTPHLAARHAVYALDRRGRGRSGDGPDYAIEREYEDVAAVLDAVAERDGEPATLVGHSYGGLVALGAVGLTSAVGRLVLYEPPVLLSSFGDFNRVLEQVEEHLLGGRRTEAALTFLGSIASAHEVAMLRDFAPAWRQIERDVHTVPRELRTALSLPRRRYDDLTMPTLLLVGETSPEFLAASVRHLATVLPSPRTTVIPGQAHMAQAFAAETFCAELQRFVDDESGAR